MPTYEYACSSCGHELEAIQRITEDPLKTCPECGKETLERLISRTAFHLKGGGWYKDGYGASQSAKGGGRTENDRTDRLSKAISDDKAKSTTSAAASGGGSSSSDSGSSSGSSSGGGSSAA